HLEDEGRVSPFGFQSLTIRLYPPSSIGGGKELQRPVAEVTNATATWNLSALLESVFRTGSIVVDVDTLGVEALRLDLRRDSEGKLLLTRALQTTSANAANAGSAPPLFRIREFVLDSARLRLPEQFLGATTPRSPADTDARVVRLKRIRGKLTTASKVALDLHVDELSVP